jgi:hypothetical protein
LFFLVLIICQMVVVLMMPHRAGLYRPFCIPEIRVLLLENIDPLAVKFFENQDYHVISQRHYRYIYTCESGVYIKMRCRSRQ